MADSPVMYEMFHASPPTPDVVAVTNVVDPEAFSQMLRLVVLLVMLFTSDSTLTL